MKNRKTINIVTSSNKSLVVFEGDSITNEIQKKGEYDARALASIKEILSLIKPNISLDIGANIGNHSVIISDYTDKLYCFEPIPFIFDALESNIEKNCKNARKSQS